MTSFQDKIRDIQLKSAPKLRLWKAQASTDMVVRDFLNEHGVKSGTRLGSVLKALYKLATQGKSEMVRLEAQKAIMRLAGGESNDKAQLPPSNPIQININPVKASSDQPSVTVSTGNLSNPITHDNEI